MPIFLGMCLNSLLSKGRMNKSFVGFIKELWAWSPQAVLGSVCWLSLFFFCVYKFLSVIAYRTSWGFALLLISPLVIWCWKELATERELDGP